jgi:hypothetical protein
MAKIGEGDRTLWKLEEGKEEVEGRMYCRVLVCARAVRACRENLTVKPLPFPTRYL